MIDLAKIDIKELASLIYETLQKNGIDAVLVGGACVSIYSHNRYQSYVLILSPLKGSNRSKKPFTILGSNGKGVTLVTSIALI